MESFIPMPIICFHTNEMNVLKKKHRKKQSIICDQKKKRFAIKFVKIKSLKNSKNEINSLLIFKYKSFQQILQFIKHMPF